MPAMIAFMVPAPTHRVSSRIIISAWATSVLRRGQGCAYNFICWTICIAPLWRGSI